MLLPPPLRQICCPFSEPRVLLRVFLELLARILSTWLLFGLVLSEVVGMKAINGEALEGGRAVKKRQREQRESEKKRCARAESGVHA